MTRRIFSLLLALMLLGSLAISVSARELPDLTKTGSISITMKYGGEPIPGGELTLYRVGVPEEYDSNYYFVPTAEFSGCVKSFDNIGSESLAKKLADYAKEEWKIESIAVGKSGTVKFSDLAVGLYLVVQSKETEGFVSIDPFLVSVPRHLDGKYVYDIDGTSKMDRIKKVTEPTKPPRPSDELPQTGQLNWPVPMLTSGGLLLFALGWYLRFGKKKESYEE